VVLVEFAIVLPIFILLILGIIYFGGLEAYSNQSTQLAEEGARWAALNDNPSSSQTLQQYVESLIQPEPLGGSATVSGASVYLYYPSGSTGAVGQSVRACVVTPLNSGFLGLGGGTVVQTATMSIEQVQTSPEWTPDSTSSLPSSCPTS
jgi:Flp pilus assembly protein TadG